MIMDELKEKRNVKNDLDLTIDDLKELVARYKKLIQEKLKVTFLMILMSNFGEL
jgi:pyruvate,orthophosphate dikinase